LPCMTVGTISIANPLAKSSPNTPSFSSTLTAVPSPLVPIGTMPHTPFSPNHDTCSR
jgi:hypothetical protein